MWLAVVQELLAQERLKFLSDDNSVCQSLLISYSFVGFRFMHIGFWIIITSWTDALFGMFSLDIEIVYWYSMYCTADTSGQLFLVLHVDFSVPTNHFLLQLFVKISLCRLWKHISSWMTKIWLKYLLFSWGLETKSHINFCINFLALFSLLWFCFLFRLCNHSLPRTVSVNDLTVQDCK